MKREEEKGRKKSVREKEQEERNKRESILEFTSFMTILNLCK